MSWVYWIFALVCILHIDDALTQGLSTYGHGFGFFVLVEQRVGISVAISIIKYYKLMSSD